MKLIRIFFVILLLPLSARAEFAISNWNEFIQLTNDGKKSMLTIKGQVKGLAQNQAMSAFSIGFAPEQKITVLKVLLDEKVTKFEFHEGALKVYFPDSRANGQMANIKIIFEEKYESVNRYLRQELIYIPGFAVGAVGSVIINFSGYDLTTYNSMAVRNGSSLTYTIIVPKDGVKEVVKFTPNQGEWGVAVKTKISAEKNLGEFSLKAPSYFYSNRQKVVDYKHDFSLVPVVTDRKGSDINYTFRVPAQEFKMTTEAKVFTGAAYRQYATRNMIGYSKISQEDLTLVTPLLQQAKSDRKYAGMPLYAAIGAFVHDYLKYDKSYIGKLPSLGEIVQNKVGVCTEFAKLYSAMVRAAGIPSIIVDGGACGEYDQCQGHSWNMIFYDNRWIEVDPTWNLMSGIVSSSHVYVSESGEGAVQIKYQGDAGKVVMGIDLEMRDLGVGN